MANFIKHTECSECGSSDGKAVYDDGSSHCFVCEHTVPSKEWLEENGKKSQVKTYKKEKESMEIKPSTKPAITDEENKQIKSETSVEANGFRCIRDDVYKTFGVRHAFDDEDNVVEQYYPVTQDGQLSGYKIREVPKNFRSKGRTGADCDLFMQFRFNKPGKYIVITEGEVDALSAYQMLFDYNKSKGWDVETSVVSPTIGSNCKKQVAAQYKFFDQYEKVVICFDNDKAGKEAVEDLVSVLPKGKTYIMNLRMKDPNEYLKSGNEAAFIKDFWEMQKHVPVGVLPSSKLYDRVLEQTAVAKVPFPPFMGNLNQMFVGGMPLGHIINIAADTGIGKTTFINEMIYYWIFHSPHKIGIVSMELDAGQYGEVILSRHLSKKLSLIENLDEKMSYLRSDAVKAKANELMMDEHGNDRFDLLDNRDGTVEEIQDTVEELVISCDAKVIVLDPLQDILDGLSNEEQAVFMKWAKGFVKSHGVTFVFINHMRKTPAGQSGADSEQNIMGSSTIIKSASANILLKRDKMAEDPIVRNTTEISVTKNRVCGITGPAGAMYYENETHTLHNFDDYMNERGG